MIQNEIEPNRATLTVPQVARLLGISRGAAYAGVERGEIPCVRIGRRLLVPRAALDRLLLSGQEPPEAA